MALAERSSLVKLSKQGSGSSRVLDRKTRHAIGCFLCDD